ncbi:MAG: Mov34/MPN/PAD-1 family protein [Candidatus Heimdallarchaeota archaeon]
MAKVEIEISPLAYAKIIDWTSGNTEREVGGYLVGTIEDKKVIITEVTFSVDKSTPTHVSLDVMAQMRIVEEIEKRDGKETILGWWHTHPSYGLFMSGTDIATQQIYQSLLPEAVAMVNDGNAFALSQKQKDYKAKFFRVTDDNKFKEIPFGVMTNPSEILDILTEHVQDEESSEKIAENTAQRMALSVNESFETITQKMLLTKDEFEDGLFQVKKGIANIRKDTQELKEDVLTKSDFKKQVSNLEKKILRQRVALLILSGISILSMIGIIILLVLFFSPI